MGSDAVIDRKLSKKSVMFPTWLPKYLWSPVSSTNLKYLNTVNFKLSKAAHISIFVFLASFHQIYFSFILWSWFFLKHTRATEHVLYISHSHLTIKERNKSSLMSRTVLTDMVSDMITIQHYILKQFLLDVKQLILM